MIGRWRAPTATLPGRLRAGRRDALLNKPGGESTDISGNPSRFYAPKTFTYRYTFREK